MVVICCADKAVIRDVHQLPQILDAGNDVVDKFLRGNARLSSLVLNFLAVLIRAGQEHDIIALQTLVARHNIGGDGAVAVSDMKIRRRIINRCGYIKRFLIQE